MNNEKKTLGIIGGMGPMATADLFYKIISLTDADSDKGHIHILIDNNTEIPDRTTAILKGDDTPYTYLLDSAKKLRDIGADFIIIPCNTSHYFYDRLCSEIGIPVISMIEETAKFVIENGISKAGLFATEGTVKTGVYKKVFEKYGLEIIAPDEAGQRAVTDMIYKAVKAGKKPVFDGVTASAEEMAARGSQAIILGCTELPIAFEGVNFPYKVINPTEILAKSAIKFAGYNIKKEEV
jgi:aspartate racemase